MKYGRPQEKEKVVYRSVAIPVSAFDILKEFQREYERKHGVKLNNNEILTIIIKQHRKFIEEGVEHVWTHD